VQFLHAFTNQLPRFRQDIRHRPAPVRAAHARDRAEAARVIAAFRNFHVGEMTRRQTKAGSSGVRNITWPRMDGEGGWDPRGCEARGARRRQRRERRRSGGSACFLWLCRIGNVPFIPVPLATASGLEWTQRQTVPALETFRLTTWFGRGQSLGSTL